jgi:hypothetical protein
LFQRGSIVPLMYMSDPVVGNDEPVALQGAKDTLHFRGVSREVLRRLQPQPRTHRQGAGCVAGAV